jgi:hypothetical protein
VRDEPGIGAFVVELRLDPGGGTARLRLLTAGELARLRASRVIVADRARAIFELRTTMAPPLVGTASGE